MCDLEKVYDNIAWKLRGQSKRGSVKAHLRGCLHDNGATFIPGRDEKLHRVLYIKPCLLGCESYQFVCEIKYPNDLKINKALFYR